MTKDRRFAKCWGMIAHRRAWNRLQSTVAAYDAELRGREAAGTLSKQGYAAVNAVLRDAHSAVDQWDLERGWKCFHAAQRMELLFLESAELDAAAAAIGKEAEKLTGWRKKAVEEILENRTLLAAGGVFRAALIRDEHFNNEAYKDGLRRGSALRLAVLLIVVLGALLALAYFKFFTDIAPVSPDVLLCVATVGLLGAIVSAITDTPKADSPARIPEMASSFRVTILRLMMGPASAIVLFFVIRSDLSRSIVQLEKGDGYAVLVIAFVAGFTERLVLRVVEKIAGRP
jgi:hypothetical protein